MDDGPKSAPGQKGERLALPVAYLPDLRHQRGAFEGFVHGHEFVGYGPECEDVAVHGGPALQVELTPVHHTDDLDVLWRDVNKLSVGQLPNTEKEGAMNDLLKSPTTNNLSVRPTFLLSPQHCSLLFTHLELLKLLRFSEMHTRWWMVTMLEVRPPWQMPLAWRYSIPCEHGT